MRRQRRELEEQYLALNPAALRRRLTDDERKLARLCALKDETQKEGGGGHRLTS